MIPARNSILSIAIIICLFIAAGCTSTAGPTQHPVQVTQQYTAVSYDVTPVRYAKVNGVTLAYREFGSGELLLRITGFGNTMKDWNPTFIGILATKYHVYIYDPRGMGSSSDDNTITPSISKYAGTMRLR
jgi:alpha-beta hydrolase superfamily lysophospholipase